MNNAVIQATELRDVKGPLTLSGFPFLWFLIAVIVICILIYFISKLFKLNIIEKDAQVDDVLALNVRDVLERRLQTQVYKQGLSNSVKQARQFIVHNKILINDKIITSPSYLIKKTDKITLVSGFVPKIKKIVKEKAKVEALDTAEKQAQMSDKEVVEDIAKKATKEAANNGG